MAGYNPYYWHGDTILIAGEYMKTLTAVTGCDSIVNLQLMENPIVISCVDLIEQCAGDSILPLQYSVEGYIDYMKLDCSNELELTGMHDTIFTIDVTELYLRSADIPVGNHDVMLKAYFHQEEIFSHDLVVRILYPNTIFEQQWNDMIAILAPKYNGGYKFIDFQWYKDGEILHDETNSYLHQPLIFGAEYSVLLTNQDGVQLMSCPIVANDLAEISVYPTLVKCGEEIMCHITEDATLRLYNSTGQKLYDKQALAGETRLLMPNTNGIYMLRVSTINNKEREIKILVR